MKSNIFSARPTALGISVLTLLAACTNSDTNSTPKQSDPIAVTVQKIAPQSLPILIDVVGRAEGAREVEVRARVNGIVEARRYNEGDPVKQNATLFQIERAPFENAVAQAKSALAQDRLRLEQTQREQQRLQTLLSKRAVSQRDADDAATSAKQAESAVSASEAKLRDAELNLGYTSVTAPISGIAGRALRSEGTLVSAGTDSGLLTTIVQTDPIWIRFSLSENEFNLLRQNSGRTAKVKLVGADNRELLTGGAINFTASTVDPKLGTIQGRASFANPNLSVLPGQFVRTQIVAGQQQAIAVPQSAVMQNDQGRFVWVVEGAGSDAKAAQRKVDAGGWVGRDWVINSGLKQGDAVIVDNLIKLKSGTPVKPSMAAPSPDPKK
jgi:membrane fusion protein (multidrug efflux system)